MTVNFESYVHLASNALPHLEQSNGSIIVLSSVAGMCVVANYRYVETEVAASRFQKRNPHKRKGRLSVLGFIFVHVCFRFFCACLHLEMLSSLFKQFSARYKDLCAVISLKGKFIKTSRYVRMDALPRPTSLMGHCDLDL